MNSFELLTAHLDNDKRSDLPAMIDLLEAQENQKKLFVYWNAGAGGEVHLVDFDKIYERLAQKIEGLVEDHCLKQSNTTEDLDQSDAENRKVA